MNAADWLGVGLMVLFSPLTVTAGWWVARILTAFLERR